MIRGNEFILNPRPRRLSKKEIQSIVNEIESAMSRGEDEIRVYWTEKQRKILTIPVRLGDRKLTSRPDET